MPSCSASSISQGDAFITRRGERTVTVTFMPPRRSAGAAAVHGRIAAADHHDALADRVHVLEGDRRQPVDADVDVGGRFLAAGNFQVLALGGAGADEHGVEAFLEQRIEALDLVTEARLDAEGENAFDFLVQHRPRQAEGRDVRPHQSAALGVLLEQHAACSRAACRSRATVSEAGPAPISAMRLPFFCLRDLGHERIDVALVVGGDALQAADGDRLLLDAATPAGRLARAIANAAQDARERRCSPSSA